MSTFLSWGRDRWLTHLAMLLFTVIACYVTALFKPEAKLITVLTIGLGYAALIQLAVTLLIGPWQLLLKQKRNPVNIYLRRDIGIWAGITGILHVILGLQLHLGGQLLRYFFREDSFFPLINPFGLSNYLGAAATVILGILFVISNDLSVKLLKGKRWKLIQRFNYVVFGLVIFHTFGYQFVIKRTWILTVVTFVMMLLVALWQLRGYRFYRTRWPKGIQASQKTT